MQLSKKETATTPEVVYEVNNMAMDQVRMENMIDLSKTQIFVIG